MTSAEARAYKRGHIAGTKFGIKLAASVASDYDKYNSHPYLVSDCILGKLNVLKGKPRRNRAYESSGGE